MAFFVVGLGNPGPEYENTRHNTGAMVLETFRKVENLPEWSKDSKRKALISEGKVGKQKVSLMRPQTFMNKSGEALKNVSLTTHLPAPQTSRLRAARGQARQAGNLQQGKKKVKEITNLAVIHDDLDIPFGKYKISFDKSSGGHRGVESIIKALKTQAFARVRVGIASSASAIKKSQGDAAVEKTILGKFTSAELVELKKLAKRIAEGLTVLITEGREKAMSQYHS